MKLSEKLVHLEKDLAQIMERFEDLKLQTTKLEQENERLRGQLSPHNQEQNALPDPEGAEFGQNPQTNDGHDTLVNLYEEGYHVCHLNFGQEREGECLFCLGFLTNANS